MLEGGNGGHSFYAAMGCYVMIKLTLYFDSLDCPSKVLFYVLPFKNYTAVMPYCHSTWLGFAL
jgi:hypothetical protein